MKKFISLILVVLFSLSLMTAVFAEPTTSVEQAMYEEENTMELVEEAIPAFGELPDTGGFPVEAFYIGGALIIAAGIFLSLKKPGAPSKEQ
jgi:LPXTG-motif cell wall-anchored protein